MPRLRLAHLGALQEENGIDGNLLDPTVRSEQPPNSSTFCRFDTHWIPLHTERPTPKTGETKNYDAFYQFFE